MNVVPFRSPPSGSRLGVWRVLVLLFAGLLTLGVMQPLTASASTGSLRAHDRTVLEPDSSSVVVKVPVSLHPVKHRVVSVGYTTRSGTAKAWQDYKPTHGRLYFEPGDHVRFVKVRVLGDTTDEADEYFTVRLFDAHRAFISDGVGVVRIIDNDEPVIPELSIHKSVVEEGHHAVFKVVLSEEVPYDVKVLWGNRDGTAKAPGDYTADHGLLTIEAGDHTGHIWVDTVNDAIDEPPQFFGVFLFHPYGATIGDGHTVGVILDNDPEPALAVGDTSVKEGSHATVDVTLSAVSDFDVKVFWATGGGTATKFVDYVPDHGVLTIPAGHLTEQVTVETKADPDTPVPDETFNVMLFHPEHATIADGIGVVTIK